ncbi:hypothetical protein GQ600_24680 [Phytophthora cactorum]|nr:hypothetical protein GQ600_24680 [Phytophthora cactorum]
MEKVLSYWNMYEYLRGLLVAKARTGDHIRWSVRAENSNAKQLLLYNLLDWRGMIQHQHHGCFSHGVDGNLTVL